MKKELKQLELWTVENQILTVIKRDENDFTAYYYQEGVKAKEWCPNCTEQWLIWKIKRLTADPKIKCTQFKINGQYILL